MIYVFIVPSNLTKNTVNIYVQMFENCDFVLLKNHHINIYKKQEYRILKVLQMINNLISSTNKFFIQIGCKISNNDALKELNQTEC